MAQQRWRSRSPRVNLHRAMDRLKSESPWPCSSRSRSRGRVRGWSPLQNFLLEQSSFRSLLSSLWKMVMSRRLLPSSEIWQASRRIKCCPCTILVPIQMWEWVWHCNICFYNILHSKWSMKLRRRLSESFRRIASDCATERELLTGVRCTRPFPG